MKLISGGCSFSADKFCWPVKLAEQKNFEHIQTGVGSCGNDLISRKVLDQLLRIDEYSDVVVGVMWSGHVRKGHIANGPDALKRHKGTQSETSPHHWMNESWIISNPGFFDKYAHEWYKWYFNSTQSLMETFEHVLRLQWYLQQNNIKYFFTTYTSNAFSQDDVNLSYTDPLKKLIDWDKFLPITGCSDWCRKYYPLDFPDINDEHPGTLQHKQFAAEVISPWLKKTYDI